MSVYFVTALASEAKPLVSHAKLKRDFELKPFQVFRGQDLTLIVSGMGRIKAAAALSFVLSKFGVSDNTLVVNFGICAGLPQFPLGTLVAPTRIGSTNISRHFIPDLIVRHKHPEVALLTCDQPVSDPNLYESFECFDMEATGIFEAGSLFLGPHQMACYKVVSDHCRPGTINRSLITELISARTEEILELSFAQSQILSETCRPLAEPQSALLTRLTHELNLSTYQRHEVRRLGISFLSAKDDHLDKLTEYLRQNVAESERLPPTQGDYQRLCNFLRHG